MCGERGDDIWRLVWGESGLPGALADGIRRRGLMHSDVCVCVDEHSDCEHDVSVFG